MNGLGTAIDAELNVKNYRNEPLKKNPSGAFRGDKLSAHLG
jgi:hypothetical protein